ncbi:MAG TPA: hypothetical protein DCM40_09835, partial [Maribacter sp.]|nr:hypothetical protein [Maribacter sp.]
MDSIEASRLIIDGTTISFDHHANSLGGNKVATFTTTGSAIGGSATTLNARFDNTSLPSTSPIYQTGHLSISFWHDATGDLETILQLEGASNADALEVFANNETMNLVIKDADGDSRSWIADLTALGARYNDFNHFL